MQRPGVFSHKIKSSHSNLSIQNHIFFLFFSFCEHSNALANLQNSAHASHVEISQGAA